MTQVHAEIHDFVGEEAGVPNLSQLVEKDSSNNHEIMCMDTTQTDIISGLDISSGPMRFSKLKDNRWEPYPERQKQRLEEQNTRRAILVQKEMLRCGLSLNSPNFDVHRSDVDNKVEKVTGSLPIKSKQDLVMEYMEAQDKLESYEAELEKIRVYRKEIKKLTEENDHLLKENQKLICILSDVD